MAPACRGGDAHHDTGAQQCALSESLIHGPTVEDRLLRPFWVRYRPSCGRIRRWVQPYFWRIYPFLCIPHRRRSSRGWRSTSCAFGSAGAVPAELARAGLGHAATGGLGSAKAVEVPRHLDAVVALPADFVRDGEGVPAAPLVEEMPGFAQIPAHHLGELDVPELGVGGVLPAGEGMRSAWEKVKLTLDRPSLLGLTGPST